MRGNIVIRDEGTLKDEGFDTSQIARMLAVSPIVFRPPNTGNISCYNQRIVYGLCGILFNILNKRFSFCNYHKKNTELGPGDIEGARVCHKNTKIDLKESRQLVYRLLSG